MNSRERVRRILNREPVDCLPNGLGGCETTGLHNVAYDRLKRILGVEDTANRICTFMNNAVFEPPVLEAMGGDFILLGSRMCTASLWGPKSEKDWKPVRLWDVDLLACNNWNFRKDSDGSWWWDDRKCPPGGFYFDCLPSEQNENIVLEPEKFVPGQAFTDEFLHSLEEQARFLYENTEYAIVCGEMIQDLQAKPNGLENWWVSMLETPEACHEILEKSVDRGLEQIKQLEEAIGKYCLILQIADDMGDMNGVMVGPELWRKIYKPHYQRLFSGWHKISGMKVSLHSCGAIYEILDDLIECGVDIYNPVQTSARGMEPEELKKRFGDRLIFWGGAYDAIQMSSYSENEVYEAVKTRIRIFGENGGYIFAGVHNLPGDIPESHLKAIMRAWTESKSSADCVVF